MELTRRHALASAGALLLSGCTSEGGRPAAVDPDDALVAAAIARELALLAAYDAALPTTPALAPLRADHLAHLLLLGGVLPSAPPTPTPTAPVTVRELRVLEHAAAADHAAACVTASRPLAGRLASLAACEASHLAVL